MKNSKLTSLYISQSLQMLELSIVDNLGMKKTKFHEKAFKNFIANGGNVEQRFVEAYQSRKKLVTGERVREQVYMPLDLEPELIEIAEKRGVGITVVMLQAILDYCILMKDFAEKDLLDLVERIN